MTPYLARIKERYRLNRPGSDKETYHIVLDLGDSGIRYKVGDCLGIHPSNSPETVEHILSLLNATGEEAVADRKGRTHSFRVFLAHHANLSRVPKKLLTLAEVEEIQDISSLLQNTKRALSPGTLSTHLAPLLPRLYSIASSMKEVGNEAHLTVQALGTCSHFLCHQVELDEPLVPIYLQKGRDFTLPPSSEKKPIIMIGPGTGIAPFRGFMQERMHSATSKKNWLFFGERNRATDYYYEDFWNRLETTGSLRCECAFSRDQKERIYVQHRLLENGEEIWNWLQEGAYLYVCGDASKMAKGVEAALHEIAMAVGKRSPEEAKTYIKNLRKNKRYLRDIY